MDEKPKEQPAEAPVTLTQKLIEKMTDIIERDLTFLDVWAAKKSLGISYSNSSFKDLEEHEKEVMENVITAAQKYSALKHDARYLLSSLRTIANLALDGFRCGVVDDIVFNDFAKDLDKEIMTEKLYKVSDKNQAAIQAFMDVENSVKKLKDFCERRIDQLPTEEASMVSKKRAENLHSIGGLLALMNIPAALQPVIQIGTGIVGIALSVAYIESDVSTIRETFETATNYLQSAEQYWGQFHGKVRSLRDDLIMLSKDWDSLKKTTQISSDYCTYFLGIQVEKDKFREYLKAEFVKALEGIQKMCTKAINSGVK